MLAFVALTIGEFFRTVRIGEIPNYGCVRIRFECDRIGVIGLLRFALLDVGNERWTI